MYFRLNWYDCLELFWGYSGWIEDSHMTISQTVSCVMSQCWVILTRCHDGMMMSQWSVSRQCQGSSCIFSITSKKGKNIHLYTTSYWNKNRNNLSCFWSKDCKGRTCSSKGNVRTSVAVYQPQPWIELNICHIQIKM